MLPFSSAIRFFSRFILSLTCSAAATTSATAQPQPPQTSPLSEQAEITPYGFTVRYPAGWSFSEGGGVWRLVNMPADRASAANAGTFDQVGQISITVERRRDHADALKRLEDVRAEFGVRVAFVTIGGWPALQRRVLDNREQPGGAGEDQQPPTAATQQSRLPQKPLLTPTRILRVTTAIAADNLLVRLEGRLPSDAPPALEALVMAIGRSATFRSAGNLAQAGHEALRLSALATHRAVSPPRSSVKTVPADLPGGVRVFSSHRAQPMAGASMAAGAGPQAIPMSLLAAGLAQRVVTGGIASETEIAVSSNGQNIVIGQQFAYVTSNDGGQTFPFTGFFPSSTGGDPSLAFGRSGAFYEATINGSSTGFNVSTDNGRTFTFRANAYTCPTTGPNPCPANFPDQEHIAADRFNTSAAGGDQIYSAWRQLDGQYGIACSNDGGQNWTAAVFVGGDLPRIAVGSDGFVYVVYQSGGNVMLNRYSSCNAGLLPQAPTFPLVVATVGPNWVQCPMPGLDRCNNGNNLSSFTVAVDDTKANHIFIAYAQSTSATNENVIIRDSTDGGQTWPAARVVSVNGGGNARRFMPWVCSTGGLAYVSWFDRRSATATNNSLTDFYGGSAAVNASGNLMVGPERRINPVGTADSQCAAGQPAASAASWQGGSRAQGDSTSCRPLPQLAGQCQRSPATPLDTNTACDFNITVCPAGENCTPWGGGVPKYGDYNGNACAAGRVYTVWPSATTPPPGPAPARRIDLYFASLVVAGSQIQIPGPVGFSDTCVGTSSLALANVCNTGKTDLHVDPITSSDLQFSVVSPSSGYPVTVSAGACFPFQVRFAPTSAGNKSATLTVPSDDSVTPSATILVSGRATQGAITTVIADAGDFGTVYPGTFHDEPLVITNAGGCLLTVTNIISSSSDFQTAQVVSYPLVVAPGASIPIPIRFQPISPSAKAATLTISDSLNLGKQVRVTGTGGAPRIATMIVDTGSFGSVCTGATHDQNVTITNSGTSPLAITNIASSLLEFQTPQVIAYPLVVAPGTSLNVPIRFAPTTPGAKTSTLTISSNDSVTPAKAVTLTAETPDAELCHPPTFIAAGMSIGPTFGSSRTGNYTFTGQGRYLVPFGERHSFGFQAQGEYLFYPGRNEGQIDFAVMKRRKKVQFGVATNLKFAEFGALKDGGALGQASAVLDLFFTSVRVSFFGTKGFKDAAVLSRDTSFTFTTPPGPGATAFATDTERVARVVDAIGGGIQVGVGPNTEVDGQLMWLRRVRPTLLGDRVGAMARITHHLSNELALFAEVTLNETLVGPTNSGRVVFGFVFGRWTRPSDLTNKHTPLGTDIPRVHYELQARQR